MSYKCNRCGYEATTKGNLVRHLRCVTTCPSDVQDVPRTVQLEEITHKERPARTYVCKGCNKVYNHAPSLSKHKKTCKKKPVDVDALQEQINVLKGQIDELQKASTSITNVTNNNVTNVQVLQINNFGYEDISHLTPDFLSFCLMNPRQGLTSLIENIHYHKDHPNNQNLRCKSLKQNIFEKYIDAEWRECDASNTLDELIRKGYRILNSHYAENFLNDPEIYEDANKQHMYERFRFLGDTTSTDYFAVKRELRILVKDRTMYLLASPESNAVAQLPQPVPQLLQRRHSQS